MDIIETINNAIENEKKEGTLSKEPVKKLIEKIVDNFMNLQTSGRGVVY